MTKNRSEQKSLRELDQDLVNHWYIACLSEELTNDSALARTVYENPYVLYRDSSNRAVAMLDRCIHRGAQLSQGKCSGGHLHCPYHGWVYGEKGSLTEVPSDGPGANVQPWHGDTVPVREQDGVIWIWPGEIAKAELAELPWRFPQHGKKGWGQYFMITDFSSEVTHLVQNFMDVPHTVFVHAKWFRNRRLIKVPMTVDVFSGHVKVTYEQPKDVVGFMEMALNPHKKPVIHTDEYIFPNLTRVDYIFGDRHFIINSQCTPVARYQTRVYTWICYRMGLITPLLKPIMRFYTRKVITQDVDIMVNHGANLRRFGDFFENHQYKNTQADELHLAVDKIRNAGREGRAPATEQKYSRQREFWI